MPEKLHIYAKSHLASCSFNGGLKTTIYFAIVVYEFLISIDVTKQNVYFDLKVFKSSKIK